MINQYKAVCVNCGFNVSPYGGELFKIDLPIDEAYNTDTNGHHLIPIWYVECLDKKKCNNRINERRLCQINRIFELAQSNSERAKATLEYIADEIRLDRSSYGFYD